MSLGGERAIIERSRYFVAGEMWRLRQVKLFDGTLKEGKKKRENVTLIVPLTPHPVAMTSPQYRSLHHDMHHPPSAYDVISRRI